MDTHDYSIREWGHDCSVIRTEDEGLQLRLTGWGRGISADDYIIIKNGDGTTRYKIDNIKYERDPADMWFAEASFAPRDS
jgi:hypothetical protein